MDVFGKVVVFGQQWLYRVKLLYSVVIFGQSGCVWVRVFVFGESGCIRAKWLSSGKSVCIWAKWLYSGKVVVFRKILLY